jgi:hypothetical protein
MDRRETTKGYPMTANQLNDFTARWLDVLNSKDAGSRKNRRIIVAALAKVHGIENYSPR